MPVHDPATYLVVGNQSVLDLAIDMARLLVYLIVITSIKPRSNQAGQGKEIVWCGFSFFCSV